MPTQNCLSFSTEVTKVTFLWRESSKETSEALGSNLEYKLCATPPLVKMNGINAEAYVAEMVVSLRMRPSLKEIA